MRYYLKMNGTTLSVWCWTTSLATPAASFTLSALSSLQINLQGTTNKAQNV